MTKQDLIDKAVNLGLLYPKDIMPGYYVNWDELDQYEKQNPQDELVKFIYGGGYKILIELTEKECEVMITCIGTQLYESEEDVNTIISIVDKISAVYPNLYVPDLSYWRKINSINR